MTTVNKIKLATCWLDGCSGCHMSLLDMDEGIAAVARRADIVYGPLVDAQHFPEKVDVAVVEGAVSSVEDMEKIQTIRKRSRILIALGDCAVTSNVPAMRNSLAPKKLLQRIYIEGADVRRAVPTDGVPALLRHAIPLHEAVKVDIHIPGCPPPASIIQYALTELLEGRMPDLKGKVKFG